MPSTSLSPAEQMRKKLNSTYLVGADECGWGSLAGPLVVCAVAVTPMQSTKITAIDSKRIKGFTKLSQVVRHNLPCVTTHRIVEVSAHALVSNGYKNSLSLAFRTAVNTVRQRVRPYPATTIIDGNDAYGIHKARAIEKADATVPAVALASCVGKARQLAIMLRLHEEYPEYGFNEHAGYGTVKHIEAIVKYGALTSVHRIPVIARMLKRKGITIKIRN